MSPVSNTQWTVRTTRCRSSNCQPDAVSDQLVLMKLCDVFSGGTKKADLKKVDGARVNWDHRGRPHGHPCAPCVARVPHTGTIDYKCCLIDPPMGYRVFNSTCNVIHDPDPPVFRCLPFRTPTLSPPSRGPRQRSCGQRRSSWSSERAAQRARAAGSSTSRRRETPSSPSPRG